MGKSSGIATPPLRIPAPPLWGGVVWVGWADGQEAMRGWEGEGRDQTFPIQSFEQLKGPTHGHALPPAGPGVEIHMRSGMHIIFYAAIPYMNM